MGRQHVLQEQPVEVLPSHDLVLFSAVLVLEKEVLTAAVLVLQEEKYDACKYFF